MTKWAASGLWAALARPTRTANVSLLILAFASSQGAMFLVQSFLILGGQLALVGLFGACFAFANLAYVIVDWGGVIALARRALSAPPKTQLHLFFWSLAVVRAAVAFLIVVVVLPFLIGSDSFASSYAIVAAPALFLGALNMGGILDGSQRSGFTGLTAAAPVVLSGAALLFAVPLSPGDQGLLLGGAFTVGVALSLVSQFFLLKRISRPVSYASPSLVSVASAAREGGLVLLTLLPSYLSYRLQVALSVWLLGSELTGLFVYSKQLVNGVLQATQFVRRAEFPRLMFALRLTQTLGDLLRTQAAGLVVGTASAIATTAGGLALSVFGSNDLHYAGLLIAAFGPVIAVSSAYAAINQVFVASNRLGTTAFVTNFNILVLAFVTTASIPWIGIYSFAVAEVVVNLVGLMTLLAMWRRQRVH